MKCFIYFYFIFISSFCWGYQIIEWTPRFQVKEIRFLIPIPDGVSLKDGFKNYLSILKEKIDIPLIDNININHEQIKIIYTNNNFRDKQSNINTNMKNTVFILINDAKDMSATTVNIKRFNFLLEPLDLKPYYIPVLASALLSESDAYLFAHWIAQNVPWLIATGGGDIDPSIYNQKNRFSIGVNPYRDQLESQILKEFIKEEKGFLLGICRGQQLTSAILGYELIQDISKEIASQFQLTHTNKNHEIQLLQTSHSIFLKLVGSKKTQNVNSYHHQAVIFHENGPLELAAISTDGITEALEFKNGHGLLMQSHPEIVSDDFEYNESFFASLKNYIFNENNISCKKLFHF